MRNSIDEVKNRFEMAKEVISELEVRENFRTQGKKMEEKQAESCGIMLVQQYMCNRPPKKRGKREKGRKKIFAKIMAENFPNLMKALIYKSKKLNRHQLR